NRYYLQHCEHYDRSYKALRWVDVTSAEMRKFFAIIFLMGHTRRDNLKEYWSTDPFLEIPIFGKLMSRKRFEQIWWCLHFNDNELQPQSTSRLFKIQPLLNSFIQKFQTVYKPNQQLSSDESVIPWRGRLRMRTYNPGKLTTYGLLFRVVTESTSGYIGNLEMYSGEGKKLQETILSVLEPYLDQNYHVHQDNYYNTVATAEHLFSRKVRVCGTIRVNRGLPPDLKEECKSLKRGETTFRRKGDILLQSWRDTCVVNMISTIHNSSMVDVQRRHGQGSTCHTMFMKGVDRADQYLAHYSLPQKAVKWIKKVALWHINSDIFNSFLVFKNLNPHSKLKYRAELAAGTVLVRPGPSTPTPRRPHFDPPGRLSGDMRKHTLAKIVKSEHFKRKQPSRQCHVCAIHKKRRTAYICKFCVMPLHRGECFEKYHTLKHF
ncbi:hypothetical protein B7P43_G16256, partial [Cryptotermes secundus]